VCVALVCVVCVSICWSIGMSAGWLSGCWLFACGGGAAAVAGAIPGCAAAAVAVAVAVAGAVVV